MTGWEKKNEIIKRCWAVNNAVQIAGGKKKEIEKWYQYFYDMHSDWDMELEPKVETYTDRQVKKEKAQDRVMEDGEAKRANESLQLAKEREKGNEFTGSYPNA